MKQLLLFISLAFSKKKAIIINPPEARMVI